MYFGAECMRYEDRIIGGGRSEEFGFTKIFDSGLLFFIDQHAISYSVEKKQQHIYMAKNKCIHILRK